MPSEYPSSFLTETETLPALRPALRLSALPITDVLVVGSFTAVLYILLCTYLLQCPIVAYAVR